MGGGGGGGGLLLMPTHTCTYAPKLPRCIERLPLSEGKSNPSNISPGDTEVGRESKRQEVTQTHVNTTYTKWSDKLVNHAFALTVSFWCLPLCITRSKESTKIFHVCFKLYFILRGHIKGTASAVFVIQHRKAVPLFLAIPFMHLRIQ